MNIAGLEQASAEKLKDAEILFANNRWEGAHYLCGYSMKFKLKACICKTLDWNNYETGDGYTNFKTHKLPILLKLSGLDNHIRTKYKEERTIVSRWNPEMRYNVTTPLNQADAIALIDATKILLNQL